MLFFCVVKSSTNINYQTNFSLIPFLLLLSPLPPPGTHQNQSGQASCNDCPIGTFMADAKSPNDACESCNPGYYQNEAARSECEACLPGKWNDQIGTKDESNCTNCTKGTYSSAKASGEECNKCAAGKMNGKI